MELKFPVPNAGTVSALLARPPDAWSLYVLAHGAGAGMRHRFLETIARALAEQGVATLRYQFPYMEKGRRSPDPPAVAQAAVRAAVVAAREQTGELPLVAGGKSFGGRMTSQAQAAAPLAGVRGLVFLGFPLHPPGRTGDQRGAHLLDVHVPALFLQGTRDSLADLDLVKQVCRRLGARATLHVVEGGDHSFKLPKRAGRTEEEVIAQLAQAIARWARLIV